MGAIRRAPGAVGAAVVCHGICLLGFALRSRSWKAAAGTTIALSRRYSREIVNYFWKTKTVFDKDVRVIDPTCVNVNRANVEKSALRRIGAGDLRVQMSDHRVQIADLRVQFKRIGEYMKRH
ncbi:hypothetical protein ACFV4N_38825 [Actinosynnema sp. NPDC059797]